MDLLTKRVTSFFAKIKIISHITSISYILQSKSKIR